MLLITIVVCSLGIYQATACLQSSGGGSSSQCSAGKDYACKILDLAKDGSIGLWNKHSSGVKDNAYAYNNIKDACDGKQASRSKYKCRECRNPGAPGGSICLTESILKYIYDVYQQVGYIHVNEIAGACHSCNSKHYAGRAVDIHPNAQKKGTMQRLCEEAHGWFDDEKSHYHCQI